jgi:hypothetical protein
VSNRYANPLAEKVIGHSKILFNFKMIEAYHPSETNTKMPPYNHPIYLSVSCTGFLDRRALQYYFATYVLKENLEGEQLAENDNQEGLNTSFLSELMTQGLTANYETLVTVNDKMASFKADEIADEDLEDASMKDAQAIESALGKIFGDYHRVDNKMHLEMTTAQFAFLGKFFRSSMMIQESYAKAMATQRSIATDIELIINALIVKAHDEESNHEDFSFLINNGEEQRLVQSMAESLTDVIDDNIFSPISRLIVEMVLVPHEHHQVQRMLTDLVSGHLVELHSLQLIRERSQRPALKAVQSASSQIPLGEQSHPPQTTPPGPKASFLKIVKD